MIILISLVAGLSVVYLSGILFRWFGLVYSLSWIPGPRALPFLGNYFDLVAASPEVGFANMKKYYKEYGKTYKIWIGTKPVVLCQDQRIVQTIFKQEENTCRPSMYKFSGQYIGPGLLMGEADEKWKSQRRCLSESFHIELLERNIKLTVEKINSLIGVLVKTLEGSSGNEPLELIGIMKPCFLDVSLRATAGVEFKEESESHQYLDAIERMSEIVMGRMFSPFLRYNCIFNLTKLKGVGVEVKHTIKHFIKKITEERRGKISANSTHGGKRKIIADAMMVLEQENEAVTPEDVENQISNHIFAAYDTLSTVSSFLIFMLGDDEKLQDELLEEVNRVAPNLLEEGLGLKEVNDMKLLDRCLKEALRMFPSAPMIGRHLLKPITTEHGTLPAGVDVYVNVFNYHRDETVYPNADTFNPDRFLPENSDRRHPLTWIPFGLGIRSCIGQKTAMLQSKVAVAMMLKKFSVKSFESNRDLKLSANLVLKSRNGIRVYLQQRSVS